MQLLTGKFHASDVSRSKVVTVSDAKAVDALDVWKKIMTSKLVSRNFQSWLHRATIKLSD